MINLRIGLSGQSLTLDDSVLCHFKRYRQVNRWNREAGGQLFAKINGGDIVVEEISGPRRTDKRSRFSYHPDRKAEQAEIDLQFSRGLHYVGDWHTHPEAFPRPSSEDVHSMRQCVRKSRHRLNSFLLVIVGTAEIPDSLHVSLHSGSDIAVLLGEEQSFRNA